MYTEFVLILTVLCYFFFKMSFFFLGRKLRSFMINEKIFVQLSAVKFFHSDINIKQLELRRLSLHRMNKKKKKKQSNL